MLTVNNVIKFIGTGITIPHLVTCSDKKVYVVKFPGNPETERVLVNEYVCYRLAKLLILPIIDASVAYVDKDVFSKFQVDGRVKPKEGYAFASLYVKTANNLNTPELLTLAKNKVDAIKILIFDLLVANTDRHQGNLFYDHKYKKILIFDHTHVFSLEAVWDGVQLKRYIGEKFTLDNLNQYNYNNLIHVNNLGVNYREEIFDFKKVIKMIKKDDLYSIMEDTKKYWDFSDRDYDVLVEYLYERFSRVDEVYQLLKI